MKIISPICGLISFFLGVIVLFGWYTHSVTLIQVHPSFVAMQYNTALGFLFCGIGLIASALLKYKICKFSSAFLILLGGLTLSQYIFGIDLSIDQLLMDHYVSIKSSHLGRMAPNTALCFLLVGFSLYISTHFELLKKNAKFLGFLGSLILALGIVAFFGYLTSVETAYGWGNLTRMAVHTSFGFIVLGFGTVTNAWHIEVESRKLIPKWFPVLVGIASITTTLLVWQAETNDQKSQILKQIHLTSDHSKEKVQSELKDRIQGLSRLAKRWDVRDLPSKVEFISDADIYREDHASIILIALVDNDFHARWITPLEGNEKYLNTELPQILGQREAIIKAQESNNALTFAVDLESGLQGIVIMIPAFRNNIFQGFVSGVIEIEKIFEKTLEGPHVQGITGLLFEKNESISKMQNAGWEKSPWLVKDSFDLSDKTWKLWLKPNQKWLNNQISSIPLVILVVGFLISTLMTMFVHLMVRARYHAEETQVMNLELQKSRDELETRIEERTNELKESEKQFRTLVGNIPGTSFRCLLDKEWTMLYMSDNVKYLSGYPPADFINNAVRTFDSIIHPDDRENVFNIIEENIKNKISYTLEYRIVHSDGRILWVREKGQAHFDELGEPEFLDGAIFDVTDRVFAEEELRKSNRQAETALDLTKSGYWHIPLDDSGYYNSSEKAVAIFGDPPRSDYRYNIMDDWYVNVLAGDKEAAEATMENFKGAIEGRYPLYDSTFAYKRPVDGKVVWIHALAYVSRDENGKATDMYGVTQDITESKLLEAELRDSRTKAEEANKAKSIFISSMSHEIRTPMNAILGYSQILQRDKELIGKQRSGVESIHRAGRHLLDIINDILDFSKIEAGRMDMHPHDFDLGSLIQDLIVIFSGKCKEKNLKLRSEGVKEGQKIYVHAEAARLRQVLVNLIGNAVKFTESGKVQLSVMPLPEDQFYFEVKDTGQGIPHEKLKTIFESFQQDEEGIKKGGTGLGLAIAKKLILAMDGDLEVESEPGKGSRFFFTITLPSAKEEVRVRDERLAKAIGLAQNYTVKAVLIDDNQDNLNVLAETLREIGVETIEAESGHEGLIKIRESKPDIIFVDYHMPGMDGLEVTKRVQDEYGRDAIQIVMISASTFDHHREQYMKEGVHGFVGKPFLREEILGIIARLLSVEYDYEEGFSSEEQVSSETIDFSVIKIPKELHTSITEMANMGLITELEEYMPQISDSGPDGPVLANHLQKLVDQFDTDGIIKVLEKISS